MSKKMSKRSLYLVSTLILNIILLIVFVSPFLSFAKGDKIYVDAKASGTENGSASDPFNTISEALKKADKGDRIIVAKGTYKENIKIKKGIKIFGSDKNEVIIEAKDDDKPVVKMDDDTEISKVTVKKGEVGIEIGENDGDVSVIKVIVKDNDEDGIRVKKGKVSDSEKINIIECTIKDNGWNGIYTEKRRLIMIENKIEGNNKDGVEVGAGSSAWLYKNDIRENDGVGLKLTLDGSYVWTKKNEFRKNDKSGIEVKTFGGSGRIDVANSKIVGNDKYGIVRDQKGYLSASLWNGLTVDGLTYFSENKLGNISHIIRID